MFLLFNEDKDMNENLKKARDAIESYNKSTLPESMADWLDEVFAIKEIEDARTIAIQRCRAAFGVGLREAMTVFDDANEDHKEGLEFYRNACKLAGSTLNED
jgi:spore cortex formation protein SpoVR/YcgB (stage V sporulation)